MSLDLSDVDNERGVPRWAYDAARRSVDAWCDKRWAWWRKDAIAWHAARYILDAQALREDGLQRHDEGDHG